MRPLRALPDNGIRFVLQIVLGVQRRENLLQCRVRKDWDSWLGVGQGAF